MKSLYYCRSLSIQRADTISAKVVGQGDIMADHVADFGPMPIAAIRPASTDYEECLACQ
jgi:ribonucleoside-diphosphate reductase alpha chain